ncbi:MAG: hypothetical protein RXR20_15890 [Paraburkholderia sp.]|uniref:hypothetical protein n=1 Tax=Paraburkholderia sp. TaxID=1926495 RepID=UPI00397C3B3B
MKSAIASSRRIARLTAGCEISSKPAALLQHFAVGATWRGVRSLAAYYPAPLQANHKFPLTDQPIIRPSIGLENVNMLDDLTPPSNVGFRPPFTRGRFPDFRACRQHRHKGAQRP